MWSYLTTMFRHETRNNFLSGTVRTCSATLSSNETYRNPKEIVLLPDNPHILNLFKKKDVFEKRFFFTSEGPSGEPKNKGPLF